MRIGIVGAGHIGATLARLLAEAGHEIAIGNSRGPESLARLVKDIGSKAQAASAEEAVRFGEVVILAAPWSGRDKLPAAELFQGKILVDAMNGYSKTFEVLNFSESSSSEEIARQFPGAKVVKAFNTLYWEVLATRGTAHVAHRVILPLAGDDGNAKETVAALISQCGFAAFDVGSLRTGGELQQPEKPLYNKALTVKEAEELLNWGEKRA